MNCSQFNELPADWKVNNINQIKDAITNVKSEDDAWFTNYYVDDNRMNLWINLKQICIFKLPGCMFVLRKRPGFYHIYFSGSDEESFIYGITKLKKILNVPMSIDLIGSMESIKLNLFKNGFKSYANFTRMLKFSTSNIKVNLDESCFAKLNEAKEVLSIINENMDPLCEQIPDIVEIEKAIQHNDILIYRIDEKPVMILHFERQGRVSHLRFWAGIKSIHSQGIGSKIYHWYEMLNADAFKFIVWVRDDNKRAQDIYIKYGMKFDQLHDEVLVYNS